MLSPLTLVLLLYLFTLLLQVVIDVPALPRLRPSDSLQCVFGSFVTSAIAVFDRQVQVTCSLPDTVEIPPTPDQQGRWTRGGFTGSVYSICGNYVSFQVDFLIPDFHLAGRVSCLF